MQFWPAVNAISRAWVRNQPAWAGHLRSAVDAGRLGGAVAATANRRKRVLPGAPGASALQVLLVDDCAANHEATGALLSRWGIEPTLAYDGAQAVALTDKQRFDIIFMDVSMPVMDGLEATTRIRRSEFEHPDRPRTPIVAYTSGALLADKAVQHRIGFDEAMAKPCDLDQMGACLARWCSARSASPA